MEAKAAMELLYDSEATLRLVDRALDDLQVVGDEPSEIGSMMQLAQGDPEDEDRELLCSAAAEIDSLLRDLQHNRSIIEQATQATGSGPDLDEAQAAKALTLVDQIDAASLDAEDRGKIQSVLSSIASAASAHEVASQQLCYAASVMSDIDTRLTRLKALLPSI